MDPDDLCLKESEIKNLLKITANLYNLGNQGKIAFKIKGKQRVYNVKSVQNYLQVLETVQVKIKENKSQVCYARISSKEDDDLLVSYKEQFTKFYPDAKIIVEECDNYNESQLMTLLESLRTAHIDELIIMKDTVSEDILFYIIKLAEKYNTTVKMINYINII